LSREATTHRSMRFEIADATGRTILVAPVQESLASWDLIAQLSVTRLPMQ
jgi:hypothetical protein